MTDLSLYGESPFDAIRRTDEAGEYWSARELMPLLGYSNWREFKDAIDRALLPCGRGLLPADRVAGRGLEVGMSAHSWRPGANGTQVCNGCSATWWPGRSEPGGPCGDAR